MTENNPKQSDPVVPNHDWKICPRCKGTGKIETRNYDLTGVDKLKEEPCILCDGTGQIPVKAD